MHHLTYFDRFQPRVSAYVLSALFLLGVLSGCGARTPLDQFQDGGVPRRDGSPIVGPPGLGIDCGRTEQFTSPRRRVDLTVEIFNDNPLASSRWDLISSSTMEEPLVSRGDDTRSIGVTPSVEGDYVFEFRVSDEAGLEASCQVTVRSIVGPPVALCPEDDLQTVIGVPIEIVGDGYDDEMVVGYQWELIESPAGSAPMLSGVEAPLLTLTANTRGTYRFRLTVADFDNATNSCEVSVLVTGPPELECPEEILAPTRQPVTINVTATDDLGIESREWVLETQPADSEATLSPTNTETTTMTPDRQGTYNLRFTATDVEGLSSSCVVRVIGTPTPPEVMCPAELSIPPLERVDIEATAVDDGEITSWRWTLEERPPGSAASPPSPATSSETAFTPDLAGEYRLRVTATDNDGETGTCETLVRATNADGIRVQVRWNTASSDVDTHLLNPEAMRWFNDDDCYYANCQTPTVLEWAEPGEDDNPRLDIDDTNGFGPENINVFQPAEGSYRVGVHLFSGRGGSSHDVTVDIYCRDSETEPRQTFGPVTLRRSSVDFWRVADINVDARGDCTITDLTRSDGSPNIATRDDAEDRR